MGEVNLLPKISPPALNAHRQSLAEFLSTKSEKCFGLCSNSVADSHLIFNVSSLKHSEANTEFLVAHEPQFRPRAEWACM